MATKKAAKKVPARAKQKELVITRDDIRNAALWLARNTNVVPVLWGATATGKTWMWEQVAKDIDAELVTVLLQQHMPDEVSGFQVNVQGTLQQQLPAWFRRAQAALDEGRNAIIFFDELGLAREEVRGAMYTFLRDRHLHGHRLQYRDDQEVLLVAATNPSVMAPALLSRVALISVPPDREYLKAMASNSVAKQVAEIAPLAVEGADPALSAEPPPAPKTVNAASLAAINSFDNAFWNMEEGARAVVLSALLPPATLKELNTTALDLSSLLRSPADLTEIIEQYDPPEALELAISVLESLDQVDPNTAATAMVAMMDGLYTDVLEKLEPYFEIQKSDHVRENISKLPAEKLASMIGKDRVMGNAETLKGSWVDRLEEAVIASEKASK